MGGQSAALCLIASFNKEHFPSSSVLRAFFSIKSTKSMSWTAWSRTQHTLYFLKEAYHPFPWLCPVFILRPISSKVTLTVRLHFCLD